MDVAPAAGGDGSGVSLELATVESTMALGRALGAVLQPGDLVLLTGSLGAGKTQLTKGIAAGMGVTGMVMSPTLSLSLRKLFSNAGMSWDPTSAPSQAKPAAIASWPSERWLVPLIRFCRKRSYARWER